MMLTPQTDVAVTQVLMALKADRDRLRDLVRRFCDLFTPGSIYPAGTMERLLREARAAIGEAFARELAIERRNEIDEKRSLK